MWASGRARGWENPEEGPGKAFCRRGHLIWALKSEEEFVKLRSDVQRSQKLVLQFTFCQIHYLLLRTRPLPSGGFQSDG